MKEPTQAINAILENEEEFSADGLTVRPLTLGRYAILEMLESPYVNPEKKFTLIEIIPTVYAMTQEISEICNLSKEELKAKALSWADSREFHSLDKILDSITRRFQIVQKAAPQGTSGEEGEGAKKTQGKEE